MHVYLLDCTPSPEVFIVRCARTSRGRPPWEAPAPSLEEARVSLRRMLAAGHHSVLEFAHLTLGFEGFSRACLDQMRTHRHLSFLAESTRHVDMGKREIVLPPGVADRPQAKEILSRVLPLLREAYRELRDVADLDAARSLLPLGLRYRWVVSGNLRAWREFCQKRLRPEAHAEIRRLAAEVVRIGYEVAPVVFEELRDDATLVLAG